MFGKDSLPFFIPYRKRSFLLGRAKKENPFIVMDGKILQKPPDGLFLAEATRKFSDEKGKFLMTEKYLKESETRKYSSRACKVLFEHQQHTHELFIQSYIKCWLFCGYF